MTSGRPGNYAVQAETYDRTRGASPTVVRLMSKHLGRPEGRRLLDIAGGTGNYAQVLKARGFDAFIVDVEPAMLARSVGKVGSGRQAVGDGTALPFGDARFDCATIVTALHLMRPPGRALAEAHRILRTGPLVVVAFTAEQIASLFVWEYFPGSEQLVPPENPPREALEQWARDAGFTRIESEKYVYLDTADGNLVALHTDPLKLAGPAYLRNTSFFQRLPPDLQREGLARLAEDLRSGELDRRVKAWFRESIDAGHGRVFALWP
jgi:ubiquinone/menaquinone biosynthesis C-methylase UbiE